MELDSFARNTVMDSILLEAFIMILQTLIVIKKNMMVLKLEINIELEDMINYLEKVLLS